MELSRDIDACLSRDVTDMVPVIEAGAVVPVARTLAGEPGQCAGGRVEQARNAVDTALPGHRPAAGLEGGEGLAR